jgi:solute carrier family 27 fatty acid transporter 1/4
MRPEFWRQFQERYGVKKVVEFYGATEGNTLLVNCLDKVRHRRSLSPRRVDTMHSLSPPPPQVGALGYIPAFLKWIYPATLLKADPADLSKPFRDSNGHCVIAKANGEKLFHLSVKHLISLGTNRTEVGLLVSKISAISPFDGYTDEKSTSSKILRGVFREGDRYMNSGDLLYHDEAGFYYWSDRVGDTFR